MELFGNIKLSQPENITLFSDLRSSTPRAEYRDVVLTAADEALSYELAPLTATLYMEFAENGNRSHYESIYHARRRALMALLLGTLYTGDDKYIRKAVDLTWAICEETTWVIPAHNVSRGYTYLDKPLFDAFDDIPEVDLFSGATGALLSFVCKYLGDKMDAITGGVMTERIKYEIERRIIAPFQKYEMRWMYAFINNWTPWIISNILVCNAIIVENKNIRLSILSRALNYLDRFVGIYGDDCGCNEGASYWGAAIGTLFDASELVYDITGGKVDVMNAPFLKKACRFIADMCVDPADGLFMNFADCPPRMSADGDQIYRMGRRLSDGVLADFGKKMRVQNGYETSPRWINHFFSYRVIKNVFDTEKTELSAQPDACAFYRDMQVAVLRRGDFTVFVKGGHNRESHNHNDVGNIMLYFKNAPIVIDVGNLEYTTDTFNDNRYKIWTNQSSFHNLPEVNGVMQAAGREFQSDGFECDENSATVSYASAYPADGHVWLALRTVNVGDESVTVSDKIDSDGDAVYHLMTCEKPEIAENSVTVGQVRVTFEGAESVTVDEIDVSGSEKMSREWRTKTLYRISIKAQELKTTFFGA